jgi:hypothetical protein
MIWPVTILDLAIELSTNARNGRGETGHLLYQKLWEQFQQKFNIMKSDTYFFLFSPIYF